MLQDYHIKIKKPMDLGTIEKRLKNVYYFKATECMEVSDSLPSFAWVQPGACKKVFS